MTEEFQSEFEYLMMLCSETWLVEHIYSDYYYKNIIPTKQKKTEGEKFLSGQAIFLLPLAQVERIFVSWREDLDEKNLDLSILRENPSFQRVYNEKFAEKIRKPLDAIPDDNLKITMRAVISKYAHRNFLSAKPVLEGLCRIENVLREMKGDYSGVRSDAFLDKWFDKIDQASQALLEKNVELHVRTVYENGNLRTLKKNEEFDVEINLTAKDFYDLSGAFFITRQETLKLKEKSFVKQLVYEYLNHPTKDFGQALDQFMNRFDEISKGTLYEKFTEDQKGSLRDILDETVEIQNTIFKPDKKKQIQPDVVEYSNVSLSAIECLIAACDNCNFGKRALRASKANVEILLKNFINSTDISNKERETFNKNGGFFETYTELLLTCMETMGQIIQNEKDQDETFYEQLSSHGKIKEVLEDLNENGENFTCRKFLSTIRNSIVHGKYVVIPSRENNVYVEFYDEKEETAEEKQRRKEKEKERRKNHGAMPEPEPKKYESKFFLTMSEIEKILDQGFQLLKKDSKMKDVELPFWGEFEGKPKKPFENQ